MALLRINTAAIPIPSITPHQNRQTAKKKEREKEPDAPHKYGCQLCSWLADCSRYCACSPAPRTKMAAAFAGAAAARRQLVGMLPECLAPAWLPPSRE